MMNKKFIWQFVYGMWFYTKKQNRTQIYINQSYLWISVHTYSTEYMNFINARAIIDTKSHACPLIDGNVE